jgi:hypothetical protein
MPFKPNPKLKDQIASRLVAALTEIDLRIETEAKKELYGPTPVRHGKVSGNLQRSIQGEPARLEGNRVRGKVGTKGVKYALPVHRRYKYIHKGLERVRPQAMGIIRKHTTR